MRTYEILKQNGMYNDVLNIISDYSVGSKDYWKSEFNKVLKFFNRDHNIFTCKYSQIRSLYKFELRRTLKQEKKTTKKKMLEYFELNGIHILYAAKQKKEELITSYAVNRMMAFYENNDLYPLTKQIQKYYINLK